MKTVLGIDLGTQSLKVVFYDYEARRVTATESAPLEVRRDDRGTAEQEAGWWLTALKTALAKVPAGLRESAQAVAVSGQQHGFVPLDAEGKVLAPAKLWCDTSTRPNATRSWRPWADAQRCIELAGNPDPGRLHGVQDSVDAQAPPGSLPRLAQILLPHDYVNYWLTGKSVMEYGDASGTGWLDVRTRRWSKELLRAVDRSRPRPGRRACRRWSEPDTVIGP